MKNGRINLLQAAITIFSQRSNNKTIKCVFRCSFKCLLSLFEEKKELPETENYGETTVE